MNENKEKLIRNAAELFMLQSYQGTGIAEILRITGLSKGSFYHFFPSKEDLGLAVVAWKSDSIFSFWAKTLRNNDMSASQRLERLFAAIERTMEVGRFNLGCPLGTMAQEMASLSDPLRRALEDSMMRQEKLLAEYLQAGHDRNEISLALPADDLARCLWSSIQGAMLMAKTKKSTAPLDEIKKLYGALLFPAISA